MVSGRRTRKAASAGRPPGIYRAAEHRVDDSALGARSRSWLVSGRTQRSMS
jgi:hypothetical protein